MSISGQHKPTASLSSTLLARKGQAKPAMRPQGFGGFGAFHGAGAEAQDDLGWNDMGHHVEDPQPVYVPVQPVPPVLVQREALREEFAMPAPVPVAYKPAPEPKLAAPTPTPTVIKPVSVATATRIGRETTKKHTKTHAKSAFTLRLDQDRHLRLRLASALHNASAQTLVTAALDQFLQSLPEVDELVRQIPTRSAR
ncbi:hypothetical protein [Sphingomonas sp.]|uniref:hypothetical protein n=1 Tax=Sphingomonas sp. TaxID=28214 RepID=UPI003340248A